MVITRGDQKAAAYLAAHQKAASNSNSFPAATDAKALTACAADGSSSSSSSQQAGVQQRLDAVLLSRMTPEATAKQLIVLLAGAGMEAGGHGQQLLLPVDPSLSEALQVWLETIGASQSSPNITKLNSTLLWLPAAAAQLQVLQQASSLAAASDLLGDGSVPQQYLRYDAA
jgi:hypothetical protein